MKKFYPLLQIQAHRKLLKAFAFCTIFFIGLVLNPGRSYAQVNTNPQDSLVLVKLYNNTGGAGWAKPWNLKTKVATWSGVLLDNSGRVTSLILKSNGLRDSLPSVLGSLTNLQVLDVDQNNLSGIIPQSLGGLTNLYFLNLDYNLFSGSIPASLGNLTKLQYLYIDGNQLTGEIPSSLGNLTKLESLGLGVNQLTGSIPSSFGNLVNLSQLFLNNNKLGGSIPSSVGNLVKLAWLDMYSNQLSGSIPASFGNLVKLTTLDLSFNRLNGSIPATIGNLINLQGDDDNYGLNLSYNQLTGSIPSAIGKLVNLTSMDLSYNQLSDSIPSSLGNLTKLAGNDHLSGLNLSNNRLTGTIPSALGNLTKLKGGAYHYGLTLANNQLTGRIPSALGNLVNLTALDLSSNQLGDSIPATLGNLAKLKGNQYVCGLNLSKNQLKGSIPSSFTKLSNLLQLLLNDNKLSGIVPPLPASLAIRSKTNPSRLYLYNNYFTFSGLETLPKSDSLKCTPQYSLLPLHYANTRLSLSAGGTLINNTYKWTVFGTDGSKLSPDSVVHADSTFTPRVTGRYTVSVTNALVPGLVLHSDTMTVTVASAATITIAASPGTTICQGILVICSAIVKNAGTNPAYQWKKNGKNVWTNSVYKDSLLANGDSIVCIITVSGKSVTSNQLKFAVTPSVLPAIALSMNAGEIICQGTKVQFTATATNGGTSPAYAWAKNGIKTGTNSAGYADSLLKTGDSVNVTLTSNAGCTVKNTVTSRTIKFTVNQKTTPSVTITSSTTSTTICAATKVIFTAIAINGGTKPVYIWRKNGKPVSTSSNIYKDSVLLNGDVVTCTVTGLATCSTADTAISNKLAFTVQTGIPAIPSAITGNVVVKAGQAGLVYSVVKVTGVSTYAWSVPDGATITAGQGTRSITVTWGRASGIVTVKATSACGASAAVTKNITVAPSFTGDGNTALLSAAIYPNPATDAANLQVSGYHGKVIVTITDLTGKAMKGKVLFQDAKVMDKQQYLLTLGDLSAGMYIVTIKDDVSVKSFKLVKAK